MTGTHILVRERDDDDAHGVYLRVERTPTRLFLTAIHSSPTPRTETIEVSESDGLWLTWALQRCMP